MKTSISVSVILAVVCQLSGAVVVREGEYHFSLESVKELAALMNGGDEAVEKELHLFEAKAAAVCSHPELPDNFKPLCQGQDAGAALSRLVMVATHSDACEICESVACTGC
ncbi:guanylin-like [Aulostomus maculatus]